MTADVLKVTEMMGNDLNGVSSKITNNDNTYSDAVKNDFNKKK